MAAGNVPRRAQHDGGGSRQQGEVGVVGRAGIGGEQRHRPGDHQHPAHPGLPRPPPAQASSATTIPAAPAAPSPARASGGRRSSRSSRTTRRRAAAAAAACGRRCRCTACRRRARPSPARRSPPRRDRTAGSRTSARGARRPAIARPAHSVTARAPPLVHDLGGLGLRWMRGCYAECTDGSTVCCSTSATRCSPTLRLPSRSVDRAGKLGVQISDGRSGGDGLRGSTLRR